MDRRKKKRKSKKREGAYRRRATPYLQPIRDPKEEIEAGILASIEEEATSLETPFGEILLSDGMTFQTIRNKDFLYAIFTDKIDLLAAKEKDPLDHLIFFEKLNDQYPNEPFIRHSIALCYDKLEEKEKYQAAVKENFIQFGGEYPSIDADYITLLFTLNEKDTASNMFGKELNLHKAYPKIKAFDDITVSDFYGSMVDIFRYSKDLETAKKCAEVVASVDVKGGQIYKSLLDFDENPWKRRRYIFFTLLGLVIVIAIIIGIIWGIVKFFQWIF